MERYWCSICLSFKIGHRIEDLNPKYTKKTTRLFEPSLFDLIVKDGKTKQKHHQIENTQNTVRLIMMCDIGILILNFYLCWYLCITFNNITLPR